MSPEVLIWLGVSIVGLVMLPFVWRRRRREELYLEIAGETPARELLNESRSVRAAVLSFGVICGTCVPVALAVMEPTDERRILTIVLLIAEYVALVATLAVDEWYSARIDRLR